MATVRRKISELTALNSASLDTTVLGVDGGTTYKIELDTLADAVTSRVNILDRSRLSALETFTSSVSLTIPANTISSSTQITNLGFISTSVNISSLNSYTASQDGTNIAFTNGINARLTTASFESFSSSVHSEILAATNEQSFNGLISGSSQLTASYDVRYVISGSITQTTWDNINGKPSGLVSQSTDLTSLNNFTASISTASLVNRLNVIESVSGSWITESETGSFLTNLSGAISSSTQVVGILSSLNTFTSSYFIDSASVDNRITTEKGRIDAILSASNANTDTFAEIVTLINSVDTTNDNAFATYFTSSNARINSLENVTSSYETTGRSIISSSAQITSLGFVTGSYLTNLSGAISSSSQLSGTTIPNLSGSFTGSYTGSFTGSFNGNITGVAGYSSTIATVTTNTTTDTTLYPMFSLTPSPNSYITPTTHPSGTFYYNGVTRKVYGESFVGAVEATNGVVSGSSQLTSSFDTRYAASGSSITLPSDLISGSSQLTSSLDTIYLTIGGDNVISGSSQLTASLDTRYAASGSVGGITPAGTVSGSSQLTSSLDLRYLVTGSVTSSILQLNTFTASNANTSLNTFTSSLNIWSSSLATTGSNSFNGNQTITGSLNVSSVAVISSSFTANSSSLTLNSGSNFYLQNNGIAQITGSLNVSGSTTFTGSISISSGSITMPNRPAFRVYGAGGGTAATTVLSGSMTIVDYNQGGWDNTTGTFTAPIAGLYQVNIVARCSGNSNPSAQVIVYKNNTGGASGTTQIMLEWAANTTANHMGGSTITKLAVGDTLKAVVALGSISFDGNDNFSVAYIG